MSEPRATFTSALWNHAGKLAEYVLMYSTSVLIARGLGVAGNGEFAGLISLAQFFMVAVSAGLEVSLNTHLPRMQGETRLMHIRTILRRIAGVRIGIVAGGAIFFLLLVAFWKDALPTAANTYFWLLASYAAVRSFVTLAGVVLTAELRTRTTAAINVGTRLVELVAVIVLIGTGATAPDLLRLFLLTAGVQCVAYLVFMRDMFFGKAEAFAVLPLISFGGIYWVNNVVDYFLGRQGDVLLLTALLPDASQASLYDVSFNIAQFASLSMTLGLGGITLATSARLAQRGPEFLDRFYGFMIRMKSLVSIPLYAFMLFNAHAILVLLYSDRFLAAGPIVQGIAAFRIVARLFGGPENAEYLLSTGRVLRLVSIGFVGALLNVAGNLLLIPHWGAMGAVLSSGVGNVTFSLLSALLVMSSSPVTLQGDFWLRIVIVTCGASAACAWIMPASNTLQVLLLGGCYVVLVLVACALVKPLTFSDREWLEKIDSRFGAMLSPFVRSRRNELAGGGGNG
jgi:O-antigen/teichoic acid export membrane protein